MNENLRGLQSGCVLNWCFWRVSVTKNISLFARIWTVEMERWGVGGGGGVGLGAVPFDQVPPVMGTFSGPHTHPSC